MYETLFGINIYTNTKPKLREKSSVQRIYFVPQRR